MDSTNYIQILKAYLQHFLVQVYQLQGDQNASFKNHLLLESCYLWSSSVYYAFFVDVIKYKRYNYTDF